MVLLPARRIVVAAPARTVSLPSMVSVFSAAVTDRAAKARRQAANFIGHSLSWRGGIYNEGVKQLLPLTPEQFERARERLMNPPPGSPMQAAKDYGIDLTLLTMTLRMTPDERARN